MNIGIALKKGMLGGLTFLVSFITPQMVLKLVPDSIESMTVGGIISFAVVMVTNVVKNWTK